MSSALPLSFDEVLTTTRSVRKRLDVDRPVDPALIRECLAIAQQAPSASDTQGFHFVVVTDADKRAEMAALVRKGIEVYATLPTSLMQLHHDDPNRESARQRIIASVEVLLPKLERIPVWVFPCIEGSTDGLPSVAVAAHMGSVVPAAWSYMLAARSRGLGTCWMNLHQLAGPAADELLGLPEGVMQICGIATAHTIGTDFKPAYRRPLDEIVHENSW
ncbi:MAG: nitroreductase family protein [Sporichthyaceae bacterium]